jgi:hypothetical protein
MELEKAIEWANYQGSLYLVYYVIKWNDEYCVVSHNHIKRHPNTKWVYKTQ